MDHSLGKTGGAGGVNQSSNILIGGFFNRRIFWTFIHKLMKRICARNLFPFDENNGFNLRRLRSTGKDFWQVHLGVRVGWVTSEGYDPFSENDGFSQVSMGATRAFVLSDSISFAPGLLWEYGNAASKARNAPTELSVHRLGAVAEGRLHLDRDLYVLAKLVPQAVYTGASIEEDSATAVLVRNAWRFGVDATAGAAWNFPRTLGVDDVVPQFWVVGEFGYGWSMNQDLAFSPDVDEDDPRASTTLDLGMLSMRGMMMRISVAMTF